MLCDRCVLSGRCEVFVPGGECSVEKKAYDRLVSKLMDQYELEGLADEILVERVAMYLIRIARAEVYEANVGVSDKSAVWGRYIAGLDAALRGLLKDLVLTRAQRVRLEKSDMFVDVDSLLNRLVKRSKVKKKTFDRKRSPMRLLLKDWRAERRRLVSANRGEDIANREKDS